MSGQMVLQLDSDRNVIAGNAAALAGAIGNGADLRVYTEFKHNEHIDTSSDSPELIKEVAEFNITYLIDDSWTAAIMGLRQPVSLPASFVSGSSMSFFLYNQNGQQAIARPYLDGQSRAGEQGAGSVSQHPDMPKMRNHDSWDVETNAPSANFVYDFETYRYCVHDHWTEKLAHDENGNVQSGSVVELADAFAEGAAVKLGISGLCDALAEDGGAAMRHEVFIQGGSGYYYTEKQLYIMGTHPLVRVRPGKPMAYTSGGWDFGWVIARTDGRVVYRRCDPYTLAFEDIEMQCGVRWFVR